MTVTCQWCSKGYLLLIEETLRELETVQDYRKSLGKCELVSKTYRNTVIWNTQYVITLCTRLLTKKIIYTKQQCKSHPCILLFYDMLIDIYKTTVFHLPLLVNHFKISLQECHQNYTLCNITLPISTSVFWRMAWKKAHT